MILNNIKAKDHGFTIVELLVVIVVIGILAAITIVSYTGITGRANASATLSSANNVMTKATTYQTDNSGWPATFALAISATTSSAALTGPVFHAGAVDTASLTDTSYQSCGSTNNIAGTTTAPADLAALNGASGIKTGAVIGYWNYAATGAAQSTVSTGSVSVTNPVPKGDGTYQNNAISCFYVAS